MCQTAKPILEISDPVIASPFYIFQPLAPIPNSNDNPVNGGKNWKIHGDGKNMGYTTEIAVYRANGAR